MIKWALFNQRHIVTLSYNLILKYITYRKIYYKDRNTAKKVLFTGKIMYVFI